MQRSHDPLTATRSSWTQAEGLGPYQQGDLTVLSERHEDKADRLFDHPGVDPATWVSDMPAMPRTLTGNTDPEAGLEPDKPCICCGSEVYSSSLYCTSCESKHWLDQ